MKLFIDGNDLRVVDSNNGLTRYDLSGEELLLRYVSSSQPSPFNPFGVPWTADQHASAGVVYTAGTLVTAGMTGLRKATETSQSVTLSSSQPDINGKEIAAMVNGKNPGDLVIFQRDGAFLVHRIQGAPDNKSGLTFLYREIRCAVRLQDSILVAAADGLYQIRFQQDGNPSAPQKVSSRDVTWLSASNGSVYAAYADYPYRLLGFSEAGAHHTTIHYYREMARFEVQAARQRIWTVRGGNIAMLQWE